MYQCHKYLLSWICLNLQLLNSCIIAHGLKKTKKGCLKFLSISLEKTFQCWRLPKLLKHRSVTRQWLLDRYSSLMLTSKILTRVKVAEGHKRLGQNLGTQAQESNLEFVPKSLGTYSLDILYEPTSASGQECHHLCMIKIHRASLLSGRRGDPSATLPLHLIPLKGSME